ncbi:MAG TPA: patatin-like phospholipase family protein [Gemmatimonadales bacterium]|nr:patatin-like phospholipase family protein [Gemmatimonadales bacterium]
MNGPTVAVVFGGGGAKGAAHLGAARALREYGANVVRYVGTSMGAVMAAACASGRDPATMLDAFAAVRERDVLVRRRFALLKGIWAPALLEMPPFRAAIERLLPERRFADLAIPCTVTAVDRATGEAVVFGTDGEDAPLIDALTASCALPPYFPPVRVAGRECVDGGVRGPVPLYCAERIACDFVVVVDVGPGFDERGTPVRLPPPLLAATDTAIGWLMAGTTELLRAKWDATPGLPPLLWVRPTSDRGATFAMERIPEYERAGHHAMREALQRLG